MLLFMLLEQITAMLIEFDASIIWSNRYENRTKIFLA